MLISLILFLEFFIDEIISFIFNDSSLNSLTLLCGIFSFGIPYSSSFCIASTISEIGFITKIFIIKKTKKVIIKDKMTISNKLFFTFFSKVSFKYLFELYISISAI